MDRLLDECLADDQCARTFPNVRTELSDVIRGLDRDSLAVTILDPVTETALPVRITRAGFAEALWIALSYPDRARKLPRIIHHAARGDFTPFLALDVATAPPRRKYCNGAHLVVCPEETQQVHRDELEGIPDEWFMPKDRLRQYLRACATWDIPAHPAPVEDGEPVHVPTLIVSGEMDPITPPVWGAAIARTLPRSRHLIVRHLSHESDGLSDSGCLDRIFLAFLRAADPNSLDARCTESMRPPRFALDAERE